MLMRKMLLGTTALLGAGLMQAAVPGAARAAEVLPGGALDVTMSGFIRFRAHGGDIDNQRNNDALSSGLDFSNDTEVHVIVRGKHDATGVQYGGTVEFEADTSRTDNTDETWLFVSGGFGELRFGDEDGPVDASSIGAYTIAAGTGGIDGSVVDAIPISTIRPTNSDDATKIRYYTPSFGGFQIGVSYTPNADVGADPTNAFLTTVSGDTLAPKDVELGDWVEGAAVYKGEFGGVGLQASVVGSWADIKNEDAFDGDDDFYAWYAGAATTLFGFKLGGGYGDEEIGNREKTYFNVGVGAGLGPANVSVTYGKVLDSEGRRSDEPQNLVFSADVGLMPGLVLAGDLSFFDSDIDDQGSVAGDADDDDGWVYVIRLGLAF